MGGVSGLKLHRELGRLPDRPLGIEFRRHVGAADHRVRDAGGFQSGEQAALGFLAGAEHHGVHRQQAFLAIDADVQAGIVDLQVLDAAQHVYAALLQQQAARPAGGLGQSLAELGGFALQQPDLARAGRHLRCGKAAAVIGVVDVDAPLAAIGGDFIVAVDMGQQFGDVEADAAGADQGDGLADALGMLDGLGVGQHLRVADARESAACAA
jgi:hypothetical protein